MRRRRAASSTARHAKEETDIVDLSLPGLVDPGHKLVLHKGIRTLSLLGEELSLLQQQQFSENELRVLIPLLEAFPNYCPYEVLLASTASSTVTQAAIARCRLRLQEAKQRGTWNYELRPLRRALWSLRQKLLAFQLEISTVRERGCSLTKRLGEKPPEADSYSK